MSDRNAVRLLALWFRAYEPPPEFAIEGWSYIPPTRVGDDDAALVVKVNPIGPVTTWKNIQNDLFGLAYEVYVHSGVLIWRIYIDDEREAEWAGKLLLSPSPPGSLS